ncbi:MAG: ParB N-terminal domain-containing protein [Evtepia sp.]
MGKFNLNELLSETSRAGNTDKPKTSERITMLSVYDLEPSKNNFYSMEEIDELKTAIELAGKVMQNLTVVAVEGGKYKVISGHRRRLASLALVSEGKTEYEFVPCGIEKTAEDAQAIREELLLIVTNSQRTKTAWDKVEEASRLRAVLEKMNETEKLPGRMRDLIAQVLHTSPTQIGRAEAITNHLSDAFKEELKAGKVKLSTAYELSGLSKEAQETAFVDYKERGGVSIKQAKEKKTQNNERLTTTMPESSSHIAQTIRELNDLKDDCELIRKMPHWGNRAKTLQTAIALLEEYQKKREESVAQ